MDIRKEVEMLLILNSSEFLWEFWGLYNIRAFPNPVLVQPSFFFGKVSV